MQPLKYIIIEDNRLDELSLLDLLSQYPLLKHAATAGSIIEAQSLIKHQDPDIIFADIEMPDGLFIEFVKKMIQDKKKIIIFITSHSEFALDGFETSALDYLLKLDKQNATLIHLNQQLEEANRTKAKLFAIIGHDFRSPISQIYQLLKLQQSQSKLIKAEEKETLETQIRTATSSLLDSMEDLLMWSKSQMQLFNIIKEPVDVSELCRQCINLLENVIRDKELYIKLDMPPDTILETDTNFLLAILRNIIHNAIKASPEKGLIIIRFEESKNLKILKVINQGALFTQQNYLEALHQTQTSKLLTGGLGLMIIDELSKQIGAKVSFETINDNETCCKLQFST